MSTPSPVESLSPRAVWSFFEGIAAVPRPSKREEKIRAHVLKVAEELGFEPREDATGNIVVPVSASPGCESAPTVVLQGHLDMVCEKNEGTEHDFDNDPIRLVLARDQQGEEVLRADGTTLGADNGVGVAMALAAASSPEVVHGPLELLFTIDEETGMTGAKALVPDSFTGRQLINLDSEEDDQIYIGCAGGRDTDLVWKLITAAVPSGLEKVVLKVSGLRGGHSGCDIHENRGNAIKLLARTITTSGADDLRLVAIQGGSVRNAIPREAQATLVGSPESITALRLAAEAIEAAGEGESYEKAAIRIEDAAGEAVAISEDDTVRLVEALIALPSGVVAMHPKIPELVQTSNNLSTVVSRDAGTRLKVSVGCLTRSSLWSAIDMVVEQIAAVGRLAGAKVWHTEGYPGWEPNIDSSLLARTRRLYEEMFGEKPHVAAIHAGLECGIIQDAVGTMDMVSFGPTITGAHSPDEQIYTKSVEKSWRFLVAVLAELAKRS